MIDVDLMQDFIRDANPVPDPHQSDPEELARFVTMAETPPRASDIVEGEPVGRYSERRRGPLVAITTAGVALALVAIAVVATRPFDREPVTDEVRPPAGTSQPGTTALPPNPALFAKQLVPTQAPNPSPISTAIGDLEFEMLEFESSTYSLYEVVWTPHGLVAVSNGRLYWSTDYYTWQSVGSVVGDSITVVDGDVIVHGGWASDVRYRWDGSGWVESVVLNVEDGQRYAFGPRGAVVVVGDGLSYSTDGLQFSPAEEVPLSGSLADSEPGYCPAAFGPLDEGQPVLATDAGFVTLTSSWSGSLGQHPICEPVVWFSPDGNRWELVSQQSPFGESAAVYEVAERGGRFVAVGATVGSPAAIWVSDDGIAWERVDLDMGNIDGIAAGGLGWVITGSNVGSGESEWVQVMWFSVDGRTWDGPYARPETLNSGYLPPQIAVGDDIIFGIGGSRFDALMTRLQV